MNLFTNLKSQFIELSKALQVLHRELLMLEAKTLESKFSRKISPYELLDASLNNPSFSWLRSMSSIIVTIDTVVDESENLSALEAHQIANAVSALIEGPKGNEKASDFWNRYSDFLASNPDVIMKHSKVKEMLVKIKPST
jgi:hypothetical protein